MKKFFILIIAIAAIFSSYAQIPEKFSYQAVIRDADDHLVINNPVGLQISILESSSMGTPVYIETHTSSTNTNGLMTLEIGTGSVVNGNFSGIDWSSGPYFIKVEVDPDGGINYSMESVSQLLSVPYALHAKTAENLTDTYDETDPVFAASIASGITEDDTTNWNNKLDVEEDGSILNEIQAISISNDTVFLSDGGFVKIPYGPADASQDDLISFDGANWVAKGALIQNNGGGQAQNNMQPYIGIYHIIALQGIYPSRNALDPFLAEIIMFAGNFAPRGWAFCDGQLLPIASYSALFSLVGTIYGGDGRTTFALPDMRGRTAIHPGQGPGLSRRTVGEKGGTENNIMNVNQMPVHNHTIIYE